MLINIIIICLILILNIAWLLYISPKLMNRRLNRFQNDLVNKHYDEVEIMYRKMRGWRHDYHNHIQVLKAYMGIGQYEQAEAYLEKLNEDLIQVDSVLKTGNVIVDAILNSKLTLIKEHKIHIDATALVPQDIDISGTDLAVLIGNVLDNAMEACGKIEDERERFIRIYIDVIKKQLYISVTNSMSGRAKKVGNIFLSEKQGLHGFGMMSIDNIVEKYHGFANRQSENGVFATEIMLPLIK